jgi:hypothetical protein
MKFCNENTRFLLRLIKFFLITGSLSIALIFIACDDDNPVTPPVSEFDSARFNWRTDEIPHTGFAGMWAQDTSNIFLLNNYDHSLYKESGGNVTIMDAGNYYFSDIKGLSNNEVYLFGESKDDYKLNIVKWSGASFEAHPSNVTINRNGRFIRGCAVSPNEIWTISNNGISKFDGIKMTDYVYEDTLADPNFLFLSNDNKIQYIASKFFEPFQVEIKLYQFNDSSFTKIFDYVFTEGSGETFLQQIGGHKFGLQMNGPTGGPFSMCMKYFTGTSFTEYFCFNKKIQTLWRSLPNNPTGVNLQNFVILVNTDESLFSSRVGIVNWNGDKFSRELMLTGFINPGEYFNTYIVYCIDENNYLVLEPQGSFGPNNTLYIGTRK